MAESDRQAFLRRRRTGIGGSDVGPILNVDRYRDALDVYLDKVQPQDDEPTPAMLRGTYLEPVVTQMYKDYTGRRLKPGKFRKHLKHPFLVGHPDRIIVADSPPPFTGPMSGAGVLEAKTANRYVFDRMKAEGLPQSYVLQLQHYMGVCGVTWGAFAVLCPDPWQFATFELEFDERLFEQVVPVLEDFWNTNVLAKEPPSPPAVDWSDAPKVGGDEVVVDVGADDKVLSEWIGLLEYFREARQMKKAGAAAEDYAKDMLKNLLRESYGDGEGQPHYGVFEGPKERVYFRSQAGRKTLDKRSLIAMEPIDPIRMASLLAEAGLELEVIETLFEAAKLDISKFEKEGAPFETLRIYDTQEED